MWYISAARFVIGLSFLSIASISDLKTRRVSDNVWIAMGAVASILLTIQLFIMDAGWTYYLIFVPIVVLLSEALFEIPELYSEGKLNIPVLGWLLLPVFTVSYQIHTIGEDIFFWSLFTIPVMMVLAFVFYYIGLIYGGADAKAVLVLAILVPFYPNIPGFTHGSLSMEHVKLMEVLFPFTFLILLNSCLILLVIPLVYLVLNLKNGDTGLPQMLFGYRKNIEGIADSFVWPMERFDEKGKLTIRLFPRGDEEEMIESLKRMGRKRVWVTPKIPFIVPMCIGFVLSFVIGNPISHLLSILF